MARAVSRLSLFLVIPFFLFIFVSSFIGRALHGDVLAYVEWSGFLAHVEWMDLRTGATQRFYPANDDEAFASQFAWSPNGQMIAVLAGGVDGFDTYIVVVDLAGKEITRIANPYAQFANPVWYPDNETLLFTVYGSTTRIFAANIHSPHDWSLVLGDREDSLTYGDLSLSPDGTRLLYTMTEGNVLLANADGSDEGVIVPQGMQPRWSADGQAFLYVDYGVGMTGEPQLYTYDLGTLSSYALNVYGFEASWSRDGSQIAFVDDPYNSDYELFVANADGSDVRQLTSNTYDEEYPQWMP